LELNFYYSKININLNVNINGIDMLKLITNKYFVLLLLFVFLAIGSSAENKEGNKNKNRNSVLFKPLIPAPNVVYKMHDVGNLRIAITNYGMIGGFDDRITVGEDFITCEYPAGSGISHMTGGGIWFAGIIDTSTEPGVIKEITTCSEGYEGWAGDQQNYIREEMFPGRTKADSIWVMNTTGNTDTTGWTKYWGKFKHTAVSDQDFICRYCDTIIAAANAIHVPMGIEVVQRSYAWSGGYADAIIFMDYTFVNVRKQMIKDGFVGFFMDMDVGPIKYQTKNGYPKNYFENNYTAYIDSNMTAYIDNPVNKPSTPLGVTIVKTPKPLDSLKVSFHWYNGSDSPDPDTKRYEYLSNGEKLPNQSKSAMNDTRFLFGFGPFNINPGDSLRLITAVVSGSTVAEMLKNADRARNMYENHYSVPPTPPNPPLRLSYSDRSIKLNWKWQAGDSRQNPEEFRDTTNYTAVQKFNSKIFEGYRLYRSEDVKGGTASFSLLKEFDRTGDAWGFNTGIQYEYVDSNLTPGKTYWYSVTSFSIEDTVTRHRRESLESSITENLTIGNKTKVVMPFVTSNELGKVKVVPNPYRVDESYTTGIKWEGDATTWKEEKRLIKFIHLPKKCTLRIYSLSGELIKIIEHDDPVKGEEGWNLVTGSNRTVASGVYLFSVDSEYGKQVGKFVIIK
jgi:hypothetical protein